MKTVCHVIDVIDNCSQEGTEYAIKVLQETGLIKYADSVFSTYSPADGDVHRRITDAVGLLVSDRKVVDAMVANG